MESVFRSGDPLLSFGPDLRILSWNAALERLTGIAERDAVGHPCWEVLGGVDEAGLVCHAGCSQIRLAREGWPIPSRQIEIKTAGGRASVSMATIVVADGTRGPVCLHLFRGGATGADDDSDAEVRLTPRQSEVLELLAGGLTARAIASRLEIAEITVRNHIRAILLELGCHSQLAAVAEARRRGAIWRGPRARPTSSATE